MEAKNLYCLSIHFKEFAEAYINKKPVNITTPCKECNYNQECNLDWLFIINDVLKNVIHEKVSYCRSK